MMWPGRRGVFLASATALFATSGSLAQPAPRAAAPGGGASATWFDPTQLPSFTGVVERYLVSPSGRVDRFLLREGPQVILPEQASDEVQRAVPPGSGVVVWGIRARRAPVITMLAWGAREGDQTVHFVERPAWGIASHEAGTQPVEVAGEVVMPLYTPQGEVAGVILQDGMVARLPPGVASAMGERIGVGRPFAAAGLGVSGPAGRALDAERVGDSLGSLGPLPKVAERTR